MTRIKLDDIALYAAVSPATVSRVLNGKPGVRDDVRSRVLRAAQELGYVTTPKVLGLIVPDSENPFFLNLRPAFQEVMEGAGYHLVIASTDSHPERELRLVEYFRRTGVSGVFYIAEDKGSPVLSQLDEVHLPVVVLDRQVGSGRHDFVGVDNRGGATQAVSFLADLGHKNIAFLGGLQGTSTALERRAGFLDAAQELDLRREAEWTWDGDFRFESGVRAAEAFLELERSLRPTAIFAANDLMAIGLLTRLQEASIRVPDDVSIVGFDDISYAAWCYPRLTTIEQPSRRIAFEAGRFMLERIADRESTEGGRPPHAVYLEPRLLQRNSTAPPS